MRASSDQLPQRSRAHRQPGIELTLPGNPGGGCSTRLLYLPHLSRLRACGPLHQCKNDSRYLKTGPQRTSRRRQGSSRAVRGPRRTLEVGCHYEQGQGQRTAAVSQTGAGHSRARAWSAQAPRHGSVVDFPHYKCCDVPFQLRINPRPSAFSLHTQTLRPVTVISLISGLPKVELDNLSNAAPRPRFDPAAV